MKIRYLSYFIAAFAAVLFAPAVEENPCSADTLRDLLHSPTMGKVELATQRARRKRTRSKEEEADGWFNEMDPETEYARLWASGSGVELAINWIGAALPRYRLAEVEARRNRVFARAAVRMVNQDKIPVELEIVVPHPSYYQMVELKTLKEINAYEPPALEIVFDEALQIGKYKARYLRTPKNKCSLLIKMNRHVLVNLSVKKCEYSQVMTDIAESLDLDRLNKKLIT